MNFLFPIILQFTILHIHNKDEQLRLQRQHDLLRGGGEPVGILHQRLEAQPLPAGGGCLQGGGGGQRV